MIKRDLTNTYLADFDLLTESLYLCWIKAFNVETNQLDRSLLKELIISFGPYKYIHTTTKENFTNFTDNFRFNHLTWVNQFLDQLNQDTFSNHIELYKQVICEVESNLFVLKTKTAQIAYGKVLLRDFDKSHVHKLKFEKSESNRHYKEAFEIILDRRSIAEFSIGNKGISTAFTDYDLSVRLINHLDFIDKLIDLFCCFEVDLIELAHLQKRNLYIFDSTKNESLSKKDWGTTSIGTVNISMAEGNQPGTQVSSKFQTTLSNDCLINIMHYLYKKKKLEKPNIEIWLFWFNRKCVRIPEPLRWKGTPSMLSNIIQHICGESISNTIKTAFCTKEYVKPTKSKYERSRMHKEIEQIITISKQKNNQISDPTSDLTLASN